MLILLAVLHAVRRDLAAVACAAPSRSLYPGSVGNQISPGCSYITVTATCRPSTCPGFKGSAASADSGGGASGGLSVSGRSSGTGGGLAIGSGDGGRSSESNSLEMKVVLPGTHL